MLIIPVKNARTNKQMEVELTRVTQWGVREHIYEVVTGKRVTKIVGPEKFGQPWLIVLPSMKTVKVRTRGDAIRYLSSVGI